MDKSKRSIVKHRTNSGGPSRGNGQNKKKGGFRSVGANLPDGAYLGKAKKLKANLIQNAKIKSRFYKSRGDERGESSSSALDSGSNPLGRFAREGGEEDEDAFRGRRRQGKSRSEDDGDESRRRSRAGPAPDEDGESSRRRSRAGPAPDEGDTRRRSRAGPAPDEDVESSRRRSRAGPPPTDDTNTTRQRPRYATREEAMEARSKRNEKWTQTSRSVQGAKRNQPDLGARMEALLDKIQGGR